MSLDVFNRELKKGSADLLVLALLEREARHGYDLGRLIETNGRGGVLQFQVAPSILCSTGSRRAGSTVGGSRRPASGAGATTS